MSNCIITWIVPLANHTVLSIFLLLFKLICMQVYSVRYCVAARKSYRYTRPLLTTPTQETDKSHISSTLMYISIFFMLFHLNDVWVHNFQARTGHWGQDKNSYQRFLFTSTIYLSKGAAFTITLMIILFHIQPRVYVMCYQVCSPITIMPLSGLTTTAWQLIRMNFILWYYRLHYYHLLNYY